MNILEVIEKKKQGKALLASEMSYVLKGYLNRDIPDYQMAALLMAIYFRGMTLEETVLWTQEMLISGERISFAELAGKKIDKHSSGGVGDKTSLIVAPLVASYGIYVPMLAGRTLGHTGGTLDKLESIPGMRGNLSLAEFKEIVKTLGVAMSGQTEEIAPADRALYALRDVTATVNSIPLITSSILSKKLAEGIDGLVLDVKVGSGAFIHEMERAEELAQTMLQVGSQLGLKMMVFLTDMNEPLGFCVGNTLEVKESVEILQGKYVQGLSELSCALAGGMFFLAEKASDLKQGIKMAEEGLKNGRGYDKFCVMVEAQGGAVSALRDLSRLPRSEKKWELKSRDKGWIAKLDAFKFGGALRLLGGGRLKQQDKVNPGVGIEFIKKVGNSVNVGDVVAKIYYDGILSAEVLRLLESALEVAQKKPAASNIILKTMDNFSHG